MDKIDKLIFIIREEMAVTAPTNSLSAGKIAGTSEAGDDPPVRKRKNKTYIYGTGYRKLWNKK
jgi:hypothetical protein